MDDEQAEKIERMILGGSPPRPKETYEVGLDQRNVIHLRSSGGGYVWMSRASFEAMRGRPLSEEEETAIRFQYEMGNEKGEKEDG